MAYEAMNNAGSMDSRLIVILNDNDMSIAPPVGAMSAYLSRLLSSKSYQSLRHLARGDGASASRGRWSGRRRGPRNMRAAW